MIPAPDEGWLVYARLFLGVFAIACLLIIARGNIDLETRGEIVTGIILIATLCAQWAFGDKKD